MKRRCFPVRGDHDLLTPNTRTAPGVQVCPFTQMGFGGVTLSDSSSSELCLGSTGRRPASSPSRRLRFEDETEMEAESRYQERLRRRIGTQGTGVLVSKPDLNLYVNGRAKMGPQMVRQCHTCGTSSGGRAKMSQHRSELDDRGQSLYWTHLNLWTEPVRETYIGCVMPGETRWGGAMCVSNIEVSKRTDQVKLNGNQVTPTPDLPVNPYAPNNVATPSTCPSKKLSVMSPTVRPKGTKAGQHLNQEQLGRPAAAQPHKGLRSGAELIEKSHCVDLSWRNSASSCPPVQVEPTMSSQKKPESPANSQDPPTSESSSDGQFRQSIRTELHSDDTPLNSPEQFCSRDGSSRLALCRLFSNIRLSRTRTGSLDQVRLNPHPLSHDPCPPGTRKTSSLLKKSPSVQSLNVHGASFMQLRKSSSVQSFGSEQKEENRSAHYRPGTDRFLPRTLSVEDIGHPGSSRCVGRVLQVCSDGTFQLELSRPPGGTFGFIISRGRGHPDSGVYVEDMLDCSTEKLYSGLLSVGDEILEVNGEKVSGLSLDQVIFLLTQNPSTMVQVLRPWRPPPQ